MKNVKRAAQEPGGQIDDGNDPVVGHAGGADDAQDADDVAAGFIRRGDHAHAQLKSLRNDIAGIKTGDRCLIG